MGDLSEHFDRHEFTCHCGCGFDTVDWELLVRLEELRAAYGRIRITSGARCPWWNKHEGGAPDGRHPLGQAADFITLDFPDMPRVYQELDTAFPDRYGLALYIDPVRIHLDVRRSAARW